MSYNTRRTGHYGAGRGSLNQNFVSGGQFHSPSKPLVQMPRQQGHKGYQPQSPLPPAPVKSALKNSNQSQQNQQFNKNQQQSSQQQPQSATPQAHPKTEPEFPQNSDQKPEDNQMDTSEGDAGGDENEEGTANGTKKRLFWRHIKAGKISKKEKRGRRNQRLRKMIQPKNALMVLNELVGGQKYTIIESGGEHHDNFAASVVIDGQEFMGYGKNKNAAKSAAAENALKHILINKLRPQINKSQQNSSVESQDIEMTDADDNKSDDKPDEDDISWIHVASYAIHRLFDSWDADGVLADGAPDFQQESFKAAAAPKAVTKRPAKQLPANADTMNPVMLLNQMRPGIMYEDYAKEGTPPAITFTIKTVCDGEEFLGKGNNKKIARKNCAYAACGKLFSIQYPPEVLSTEQPATTQ